MQHQASSVANVQHKYYQNILLENAKINWKGGGLNLRKVEPTMAVFCNLGLELLHLSCE